ncbi:MAG: hypothetical protein COA85_06885 [Robiginitomaculum sp.]|nr:MAG: hypothetical protein COA85_06885 [Robiginitomaculum sp.]
MNKFSFIVFAFLSIFTLQSCKNSEEKANELFVETQKDLLEVESLPPLKAFNTLKKVKHNINTIIRKYPSSSLAVKLSSGQKVGEISLIAVNQKVALAESKANELLCFSKPSVECLIRILNNNINNSNSDEIIANFIKLLIFSERKKDAFIYANNINDNDLHLIALSNIASAQVEVGNFNNAIETLSIIDTPSESDNIFLAIALKQVVNGNTNSALEFFDKIKDPYTRITALVSIALAQEQSGEEFKSLDTISKSLNIVKNIDTNFFRSYALISIALAQNKSGNRSASIATFKEALKAAKSIGYARNRQFAFLKIAKGQLIVGNKAASVKAYKEAILIDGLYTRASIAVEMAKSGLLEESLVQLSNLKAKQMGRVAQLMDAGERTISLASIAVIMAESGHFKKVLEIAKGMSNEIILGPSYRFIALQSIAEALAKAGLDKEAKIVVKSGQNHSLRASLHESVAIAQTQALAERQANNGLFKDALLIANSIRDEAKRSSTISKIAIIQADAGLFSKALSTVDILSDGDYRYYRNPILKVIITEQIKAGSFKSAIDTAKMIEYYNDYNLALIDIAAGMESLKEGEVKK